MPRIRTIKPDFFQHERLYDAELTSGLPLRVAFAGLWTVADKSGRFEWRPRQLKLNVLPYDDVDFAAVLSALESGGFVQRYAVEAKEYGCIPAWDKHQHRNVREPDSTIPGPDMEGVAQVSAPVEAGASTCQVPDQAAGKGREGKGKGREREDAGDAAAPPAALDLAAWKRWHDYRREIRKPLKPVSIPAAQRELAAFGCDQSAVVEQSIAHGWQGLFELKHRPNGAHRPGAQPRPRMRTADEIEAEEMARAQQ